MVCKDIRPIRCPDLRAPEDFGDWKFRKQSAFESFDPLDAVGSGNNQMHLKLYARQGNWPMLTAEHEVTFEVVLFIGETIF